MIREEKQFVTVTTLEGKTYKINKETCEFIGLKGRPVKAIPTAVINEFKSENYYLGLAFVTIHRSKMEQEEQQQAFQSIMTLMNYNLYLFVPWMLEESDKYKRFIDLHQLLKSEKWEVVYQELIKKENQKRFYYDIKKLRFKDFIAIENLIDAKKLLEESSSNKKNIQEKVLTKIVTNIPREIFVFLTCEDLYRISELIEQGYADTEMDFHFGWSCTFWAILSYYVEKTEKLGITRKWDNFYTEVVRINSMEIKSRKEKLYKRYQNFVLPRADYEYGNDRFCIVAPTSMEEIERESEILNTTWYKRKMQSIGKGHTLVVFLREKTNIEKPFYMLELSTMGDYRVTCERLIGDHNTVIIDEDVREFIEEYDDILSDRSVKYCNDTIHFQDDDDYDDDGDYDDDFDDDDDRYYYIYDEDLDGIDDELSDMGDALKNDDYDEDDYEFI